MTDLEAGQPADLSNQSHRQLIGYLGFLLPFMLLLLSGLRPTPGLPRWDPLTSISAYYYSGAVVVFVGVLVALAMFLFTYRGYYGYRADRILGTVAGAAALGVALFPTGAPGDIGSPSWWTRWLGILHYVSAVVLFGTFIVFALWLFRKTNVPKGEALPPDKRRRNRIFLACGLIMIGSVLWAASALFTGASIFLPEALALWTFSLSWLIKGQAHTSLVNTAKRLVRAGPTQ